MITAYTCQTMTGRMCDEMIVEARMLERTLSNHGIRILNPVLSELDIIPNEHITLPHCESGVLERVWKADKLMIKEADIVIDYKTHNRSDGSNNEVGYNRFCLWKPTIRVWEGPGALISRMEHEFVVPSLMDAINVIKERFNTYEQLGQWREEMLERSFPKWLKYQHELLKRYGMDPVILEKLALKAVLGGK
jgi:hypothetical protein